MVDTNKQFTGYTHLEEKVEAIQLSPETAPIITRAFTDPATRLEMAKLNILYSITDMCYRYYFRYNEDSVESYLARGDYLVRLNDGRYTAYTEAQFNKNYIHTSVDPIIPAMDVRSVKGGILAYIEKYMPMSGIVEESQLTQDILINVANGMSRWYNASTNVFNFNFYDCGIISPAGFGDILTAYANAVFLNRETTFNLVFSNGQEEDPEAWNKINLFNKIALQELVGEIKKAPVDIAKRIQGIDFTGNNGKISAIAPSVTDDYWDAFATTIIGLTGIYSSRQIHS